MHTSIHDLEKRIAELKREIPTRGLERHISVLRSISELPTELQSPVVTRLADNEAIHSIIAFPPQIQRGRHYVPKQALLFTPTDLIHLRASVWPGQEPDVTCLRACGLLYMQVKLLLLYGFLEVVAQGQGLPTHLGMEFNTVAWYRLSQPLRQLLRATRPDRGLPGEEPADFSELQGAVEKLPLKFSNGIELYGLLPGEELEELFFQAATWKRQLHFFRRQVTPNTLILLTGNYVVMIREELNVAQGWIITYIPRGSIAGMQNQPAGPWNELTVQLKRADQSAVYRLLLKSEAVEGWRTRWIRHGGQWQDLQGEPQH